METKFYKSRQVLRIGTRNFDTISIQVFNLRFENLESISWIVWKLSAFCHHSNYQSLPYFELHFILSITIDLDKKHHCVRILLHFFSNYFKNSVILEVISKSIYTISSISSDGSRALGMLFFSSNFIFLHLPYG